MAIQSGYVYCGQNYFGVDDNDWRLLGSEGVRYFQKYVAFPTQFNTLPEIIVSISAFHILKGSDPRVQVQTEEKSTTGFDVLVNVYGDTSIKGLGISWIAHEG